MRFLAWTALWGSFLCAPLFAQSPPAPTPLRPCGPPGVIGEARCGEIEVPADHAAEGDPRTLPLRVVVLLATEQPASPDPVVYLAGGPGASATASAGVLSQRFEQLRRTRDIVLIDQRGTGNSAPYNCRMMTSDGRSASLGSTSFPRELIEECARGKNGYPAEVFTTWQAAEDLALATATLGYDQLNLYGVSYGTRLGLVFLNRHPERVRSLMVQSVVLPSVPIPFAGTIAAQESLEHFFVDCRADEGCNNAYPDLESQTRKLLATDGEAGFIFNTAITAALYDPRITANLPAAVDLAADNHFQPLLTLAAGSREGPSATTLSSGAYLAVLCSEDVPFVGEDELEQAAETVFTDRTLRGLVETCRPWPSVELPEGARDLPTSEVPVLLVSGELDPVTSAKHAQLAADQLPNSRLIVMKAAGHSGASNDCALNLLTQFVAAGAVDSLDVACAQAGQRPAFPLP